MKQTYEVIKFVFWFTVAVTILSILTGCSTIEWGAKYVADGYCAKTLEERMVIRYNVNHYIHPDKIEVTCSKQKPRTRVPAELIEVP